MARRSLRAAGHFRRPCKRCAMHRRCWPTWARRWSRAAGTSPYRRPRTCKARGCVLRLAFGLRRWAPVSTRKTAARGIGQRLFLTNGAAGGQCPTRHAFSFLPAAGIDGRSVFILHWRTPWQATRTSVARPVPRGSTSTKTTTALLDEAPCRAGGEAPIGHRVGRRDGRGRPHPPRAVGALK